MYTVWRLTQHFTVIVDLLRHLPTDRYHYCSSRTLCSVVLNTGSQSKCWMTKMWFLVLIFDSHVFKKLATIMPLYLFVTHVCTIIIKLMPVVFQSKCPSRRIRYHKRGPPAWLHNICGRSLWLYWRGNRHTYWKNHLASGIQSWWLQGKETWHCFSEDEWLCTIFR